MTVQGELRVLDTLQLRDWTTTFPASGLSRMALRRSNE